MMSAAAMRSFYVEFCFMFHLAASSMMSAAAMRSFTNGMPPVPPVSLKTFPSLVQKYLIRILFPTQFEGVWLPAEIPLGWIYLTRPYWLQDEKHQASCQKYLDQIY